MRFFYTTSWPDGKAVTEYPNFEGHAVKTKFFTGKKLII